MTSNLNSPRAAVALLPRNATALVALLTLGGVAGSTTVIDGAARPEPAPAPRFEVGRYAPEIALPSAAGDARISLARFRGKRTILHIFASW